MPISSVCVVPPVGTPGLLNNKLRRAVTLSSSTSQASSSFSPTIFHGQIYASPRGLGPPMHCVNNGSYCHWPVMNNCFSSASNCSNVFFASTLAMIPPSVPVVPAVPKVSTAPSSSRRRGGKKEVGNGTERSDGTAGTIGTSALALSVRAPHPLIIKSIKINLPRHHRLFGGAQRRLFLSVAGQILFQQLERTVAVDLINRIVHPPKLGILFRQT